MHTCLSDGYTLRCIGAVFNTSDAFAPDLSLSLVAIGVLGQQVAPAVCRHVRALFDGPVLRPNIRKSNILQAFEIGGGGVNRGTRSVTGCRPRSNRWVTHTPSKYGKIDETGFVSHTKERRHLQTLGDG